MRLARLGSIACFACRLTANGFFPDGNRCLCARCTLCLALVPVVIPFKGTLAPFIRCEQQSSGRRDIGADDRPVPVVRPFALAAVEQKLLFHIFSALKAQRQLSPIRILAFGLAAKHPVVLLQKARNVSSVSF